MYRRHLLLCAGAASLGLPAAGQDARISARTDFDQHVVQSGHSLTDGILAPLSSFLRLRGSRRGSLTKSTIPGSTMDWRWDHESGGSEPFLPDPAAMAAFDVLVITERVPLSGTVLYHDSSGMTLRWAEHAWRYGGKGKGASTVLYATWAHINSGPDFDNVYRDPEAHLTFAQRMPLEMRRWQTMLDEANARLSPDVPAIRMIPGPLIMLAAHADILAGKAPGISSPAELFGDDIHLSDLGNYLIALAHFSVLYDQDPRGLPANIPPRTGPAPDQAAWMQDLVWRVLTDYQEAENAG